MIGTIAIVRPFKRWTIWNLISKKSGFQIPTKIKAATLSQGEEAFSSFKNDLMSVLFWVYAALFYLLLLMKMLST